jgi:hypothetical protein
VNDTGWNDENGSSSVVEGELDDAPTCSLFTPLTIVVTGTMSTPERRRLDRSKSDAEQVPDQAAIGRGRCRTAGKVRGQAFAAAREVHALGELDAVGRRLHAVVADLLA